MANSKVVYGNETIMDITDSTVDENSLLKGITAYAANGEKITGVVPKRKITDTTLDDFEQTVSEAEEGELIIVTDEEGGGGGGKSAPLKIANLGGLLNDSYICNYLMENENFLCKGFFYNSDAEAYCEYEGLYNNNGLDGEDLVHYGYCDIRGIHESDYNVSYFIDDEDGSTWHKKVDEYEAIADVWNKTKVYAKGSSVIFENILYKCLIGGAFGRRPDLYPSYWKMTSVVGELGGLSFGKDGDGNYGYYGDDGVLVPFKSDEITSINFKCVSAPSHTGRYEINCNLKNKTISVYIDSAYDIGTYGLELEINGNLVKTLKNVTDTYTGTFSEITSIKYSIPNTGISTRRNAQGIITIS